ncbi:MAG: thioredoxin family protein [Rhizobiaceae bacterium]|nr:thioredoxin family protein [Hyphomicrobiales bacterium]NRB28972.1 thioredoxin family protein [Rhizobiaceae bacterium]
MQADIATREQWLEARRSLLNEEKALLQQRDAVSAKRRQLPWVAVSETYQFETDQGRKTLADLFGDKSQLIVQHFMMGENWEEGCPSCSFWADGFDGTTMHLAARDAAFVCVSNTSLEKITAYKKRMGWRFDWVSSLGSSFNHDYQASFTDDAMQRGQVFYNFHETTFPASEAPGISIFALGSGGDGMIYHTYSCYARGLDNMNVAYQYLDLLPKGRDEEALPHPMAWVKRHDQY